MTGRVDIGGFEYFVVGSTDVGLINPGVMNLYDIDREFHLDAEISIIHKGLSSDGDSFGLVPAPSEFVKDIMEIQGSKETSDVKIICEGKEFKCHRAILCARSETLKNMLLSDTIENASGIVVIKNSMVKTVEFMLSYIYTGDIPGYLGQEENLHLLQL